MAQRASNPEPEAAIDGAVLASLRELGGTEEPGLFIELLDLFLEDARGQLENLRRASAQGDLALLERTAHTLKSSSASVGARRLSRLCSELEQLGRSRQAEPARGLVEALAEHFGEVRAALESAKGSA